MNELLSDFFHLLLALVFLAAVFLVGCGIAFAAHNGRNET